MKVSSLFLLSLSLIGCITTSQFAAANGPDRAPAGKGGMDGGGGNGGSSKAEDVRQFVLADGSTSTALVKAWKMGVRDIERVISPTSGFQISDSDRALLTRVVKNRAVLQLVNDQIGLARLGVTSGSCYYDKDPLRRPKDASVNFRNGKWYFCFSENLKRYPFSSLTSEITALSIHELAHVAEIDDEDAAERVGYLASQIFGAGCGIVLGDGRQTVHVAIKQLNDGFETYEWKSWDVDVTVSNHRDWTSVYQTNPNRPTTQSYTYHLRPQNVSVKYINDRVQIKFPFIEIDKEVHNLELEWKVRKLEFILISEGEALVSRPISEFGPQGVVISGCRIE